MLNPSIRFYRASDLAEPVLQPIIATTTVDATSGQQGTTETALATITIPADWMTVGKGLWLVAAGTFRGQTSLGSPTTTWRVRIGGVAGVVTLASNSYDLGLIANEYYWDLRALITCRTIGTSGTLFSQGAITLTISGSSSPRTDAMNAAGLSGVLGNTATQAINTTVSNSIVLTAQHSATATNHYVRITNAHCLAIGG